MKIFNRTTLIENKSLDKVFELIRVNYSQNNDEEFFLQNVDGIGKVKDFLSICYQRRNCCAHRGENCINDSDRCVKKDELQCIKYNIIHSDEPVGFQDRILRRLEELVIDLLTKEVNKEFGNFTKQTDFINRIIS